MTVWWLPGFLAADTDPLPVPARLVPLPTLVDTDGAAHPERLAATVATDDVLVGYSMGARVALAAVVAGARPRALVLLSATPGLEDPTARDARRALDDARAAALLADPLRFLAAWQDEPVFAASRTSALWRAQQEARRAIVVGELARHGGHGPWCEGQARALRAFSTGRLPSSWDSLDALPVDTVWLSGALDVAYTGIAARAAARMPHARAVVIPGVGHVLPLEAPAAVARVLHPIIAAEGRTSTKRGRAC